MARIIKTKLNKKSVKVYEEFSGFKTTGDVEVHTWDKKTQQKINKILDDLLIPKSFSATKKK